MYTLKNLSWPLTDHFAIVVRCIQIRQHCVLHLASSRTIDVLQPNQADVDALIDAFTQPTRATSSGKRRRHAAVQSGGGAGAVSLWRRERNALLRSSDASYLLEQLAQHWSAGDLFLEAAIVYRLKSVSSLTGTEIARHLKVQCKLVCLLLFCCIYTF